MASVNVPEFSPEPLQWEERERAFICTKTRRRFYLVSEDDASNSGTDQNPVAVQDVDISEAKEMIIESVQEMDHETTASIFSTLFYPAHIV